MNNTALPEKNICRKKNNQAGMSLIELLLVVVIIGIIATIAIARFQAAVKASNEASAISAIKVIFNAEASYRAANPAAATIDQLMAAGSIDEAFDDTDGNPNTGARNGYLYQLTDTGTSLIISAIPESSGVVGTGRTRIGASGGGVLYKDADNLTTHYVTEADLTSGTSVPLDGN
jgi:prepilin-type N-terminal cleavage/methylation domain-containing protein